MDEWTTPKTEGPSGDESASASGHSGGKKGGHHGGRSKGAKPASGAEDFDESSAATGHGGSKIGGGRRGGGAGSGSAEDPARAGRAKPLHAGPGNPFNEGDAVGPTPDGVSLRSKHSGDQTHAPLAPNPEAGVSSPRTPGTNAPARTGSTITGNASPIASASNSSDAGRVKRDGFVPLPKDLVTRGLSSFDPGGAGGTRGASTRGPRASDPPSQAPGAAPEREERPQTKNSHESFAREYAAAGPSAGARQNSPRPQSTSARELLDDMAGHAASAIAGRLPFSLLTSSSPVPPSWPAAAGSAASALALVAIFLRRRDSAPS